MILAPHGIAVVAYLDDMLDWPFAVKLAAQVAAALVAVGSGLTLSSAAPAVLGRWRWAGWRRLARLAWILFATNAMNFIDGLNGLAAGVAIAWPGAGRHRGGGRAAGSCTSRACCWLAGLLGFLPFNFPRARIFMGDVGSQFCGFVLAVLGVSAARFGGQSCPCCWCRCCCSGCCSTSPSPWCAARWRATGVTEAHRGHLYQVAQRSGLRRRR